MKNSKGAFGSIASILKAAVITLVLTVLMLGGVLVGQDVSEGIAIVDEAPENQSVTGGSDGDNDFAQVGSNFEIIETDRLSVFPIPIAAHNAAVENNIAACQFRATMPMFLDGEIDPGGSGQQVPISRPKL